MGADVPLSVGPYVMRSMLYVDESLSVSKSDVGYPRGECDVTDCVVADVDGSGGASVCVESSVVA
jgi:hypothetical protein